MEKERKIRNEAKCDVFKEFVKKVMIDFFGKYQAVK